MIDDVYNAKILAFAGNIERLGRLEHPMASAKAHSKLCGSTVTVDIAVENGLISDYAHEVKACALGQAAASILARHAVGSTLPEIRETRDIVTDMLKRGGEAPQGKFEDYKYLEPVRDYKARHASTLLALNALVEAFEQIDGASDVVSGKLAHVVDA